MNFKINSRPLFTIIFKLKNDNFKNRDFSPLIERVLAGVCSQETVDFFVQNVMKPKLFESAFNFTRFLYFFQFMIHILENISLG